MVKAIMPRYELMLGDCIALMAELPASSIDLVLCDLPYGVTECSWDRQVPHGPLWAAYGRLLRRGGAILLFGQQPFSTHLAAKAPKSLRLRYEWIWDKCAATGFQNANRMPMRRHESVLVFYRQLPVYRPQGLKRYSGRVRARGKGSEVYGQIRQAKRQRFTGYPTSILPFRREAGAVPCQKPVALLEYLIRTYTRPKAVVLDNCMGSGSTGVAAARSGRRFVGMERDVERFALAAKRITEASRI